MQAYTDLVGYTTLVIGLITLLYFLIAHLIGDNDG